MQKHTIEVGGASYSIGLTVGASEHLATALGITTYPELFSRLGRMEMADAVPVMTALLASNGIDVPAEAIRNIAPITYFEALNAMQAAAFGGKAKADGGPALAVVG